MVDTVIDIRALSAQGAALQAAGRLDGAIAVYTRLIEAAPQAGFAEHNLASAYGDNHQFAESEAAARRAFSKGLDAPETWLVLGRALQGLGRFDEAEDAFRQSIARRPAYADAQRDLAQLVWMRGEDLAAARAALDQAIAVNPGDIPLKLAAAALLEYAGQPEAAYAVLDQGLSDGLPDPRLDIAAAQLRLESDPASALLHASRAHARAPTDAHALTALCQANLALGRAELAAAQAAALRQASPFDQQAVALQATAWRLQGDPRYGALYDYARLVREWTIDTPDGWSSLDAYLADLARSLQAVHRLRAHPIGQSLRGGAQTTQNLDRLDDPVIQAFFQAIDGPIRRHIAAIGEAGDYRLNGVWSVRLRPNGYHANHLHPMGWISSACYVALPKSVDEGHEAWIAFGEPGIPTSPRLPPQHFVKPEPGKLVLFPAYMWHGTVPFTGDEPRLTIAFDVVRANN
ncbi:MAG TPA: putative 2OG-Fe(II) oxygenase [Caulobacteraceae bacterium]|jgi:tetratricopeptide (TPR) repeat protein|nr:putative 2OG-Fe(II) oxygenase [Caulobacteraceae bacterium]